MQTITQTSEEKISKAINLLEEATASETENLRTRMRNQVDRARTAAIDVKDKVQENVKIADQHVHENPWRFIAGASVLGALLGFLFGMRRS